MVLYQFGDDRLRQVRGAISSSQSGRCSVKILQNQLDAKNPMAQAFAKVKEVGATFASLFQPQTELNFNFA